MAEQYHKDIDFAFFFVNFGTSRAEYLELTKREKMFIRKAWEDKITRENTFLRNAVLNAVNNAFRKKGAKFIDLFKAKQRPVDIEVAQNHLEIVKQSEEKEGKSWVDLIYQANGLKPPERGENG